MSDQRKKPIKLRGFCRFSRSKPRWKILLGLEEFICSLIVGWLSRIRLVPALEYLGKLGLLFALIYWICEIPQRKQAAADLKKSRHYVAWQTINSAVGKPGNAGRSDALQELNDDHVELYGISLKGGAVIIGSRLKNARMAHADLSDGYYDNVKFSDAELYQTSWSNAWCSGCDFQDADFRSVTFSDVVFDGCNFAGANFDSSIWRDAKFYQCNFAFANLWSVRIMGDVKALRGNLLGASNASTEFVYWAARQTFDFTNVRTFDGWTNVMKPLQKRPHMALNYTEFQAWATNQMRYAPNDWNEWLKWCKTNFNK
jgi:hypothetical protein